MSKKLFKRCPVQSLVRKAVLEPHTPGIYQKHCCRKASGSLPDDNDICHVGIMPVAIDNTAFKRVLRPHCGNRR